MSTTPKITLTVEIFGDMSEVVFMYFNKVASGFVKAIRIERNGINNVIQYLVAIDDGGEFPEQWFGSLEIFGDRESLIKSL
jgi:hypothetical protein